jgi:hypothetical protein
VIQDSIHHIQAACRVSEDKIGATKFPHIDLVDTVDLIGLQLSKLIRIRVKSKDIARLLG